MRHKTTIEQLEALMSAPEVHVEFKEAKGSFSRTELFKYAVAIANEGGGKIVLGVTDRHPRAVVGSAAFRGTQGLEKEILDNLKFRVEMEEVEHPRGRVVLFHVPSRPTGRPYSYEGRYLMRSSDSVVQMTEEYLRSIFAETETDFSADICPNASVSDLSVEAIERFRQKWHERSGNQRIRDCSLETLLQSAGLLDGHRVTNAALILFGRAEIIGRTMPQCEVIYEYRLHESSGPANERIEFKSGIFLTLEALWETIGKRNDMQSFQDGLFVRQVLTFNEAVVREALLNALTHRNYRMNGPVFVVQYPRKLVVKSPGGFPRGVNPENVLDRHEPRNRRIAEAFQHTGLVERAGQGVDKMYELAIREGKNKPDYSFSDDHQVVLILAGEVIHPELIGFLESVSQKTNKSFSTLELIVLSWIHDGSRIPDKYSLALSKLCEQQIIERIGKGRGTRYILSKAYYTFVGSKGTYTRTKRLDRNTNKELLLQHLAENVREGSPLKELMQVLPQLSKDEVRTLLRELRSAGLVVNYGRGASGRWFVSSKVDQVH